MVISQRCPFVGQISEAGQAAADASSARAAIGTKVPNATDTRPPWQDVPRRRYRCHWSPAELRALQGDACRTPGAGGIAIR